MKTAVIYGSTGTGKKVYDQVKNKYNILYFVDENPERIGEKNNEVEIRDRESIMKQRPDVVIMGMLTGFDEAVSWLGTVGFDETSIVSGYVDLSLRSRQATLESISKIIKKNSINGNVAELGVYRGDFAKLINSEFTDRLLYLFDTFEGFPDVDLSLERDQGRLKNEVGKLANTSVEYVLGKMPYPDMCIIKQGYFPETVIGLEDERYVFVNIDTDLYPSIKAGLEYFWPRLSKGGYIMVHDYFSNAYSGACQAIEEFAKQNGVGFAPVGDMHSVIFVK